MKIRLALSAWFTVALSLVGFIASATIAINVAHGGYPTWAAWPGFLVGLIPLAGSIALAHDLQHAKREDAGTAKIHRIGS